MNPPEYCPYCEEISGRHSIYCAFFTSAVRGEEIPPLSDEPPELNMDSLLKNALQDRSILDLAKDIIYSSVPEDHTQLAADQWSLYLRQRFSTSISLTSNDVCLMMILLKVARLANDPTHLDSQVDLAGYAALMERVQKSRKQAQD